MPCGNDEHDISNFMFCRNLDSTSPCNTDLLMWGECMKSILLKSTLVTLASIVLSYALIFTVIPLMGEPVTPAAWVLGFICPPFVAMPVSAAIFRQAERLRETHARLVEAHRQLKHKASHDQMTGLLNRETFFSRLERHQRRSDAGVLLIADADYFKRINDTYGHLNGDLALEMIAEAIKESVRDQDMAGRIGGEEFAIFVADAGLCDAKVVSERLRRAVEALPFTTSCGADVPLTVSIGGASTEDTSGVTELMRYADQCLYEAKRTGRNRVMFHVAYDEAA